MPGPTPERPRAHRLNDIEPQTAKALGCNRSDDFSTPVSSGSNMGSIARFPKLDECAHFHYEHVELGALEVSVSEGSNDTDSFAVRVTSGDACWTLQRSYDNFVMFDKQLHRCIFDRKFSSLTKLPDTRPKNTCDILRDYLNRFSQLNHEGLNCGPVLNWLQLDNRGRRILVPESDSCPINTPAVAAAYAVRPYVAQAQDEISFQVGDMISVIDMPPAGESTWWRGKHGFAVGFFPAECVAVIGDKVPRHLTVSTTVRSKLPVKPVLRKHGKLIAFFRSFILNRPSRRRLKQSGILKERVFGCDLGEHLLNSGQDVPTVLTCCAEFIESHGLVDGIYRLSGVTSNIQRLRNAFDEDRVPALHSDESILQDIHSVASLLKMYFRELPNPLCTYQLYSTFVNAVQANTDAERLRRMRDAVRKLPPPHYRTLEYLMRHLVRVAARGAETGMTPRNVAIVWAPNLLRCKELEVGGVAALQGVGVQAVVTEFLVCYAELIFGDGPVGRPKSLAITTPARLLSLEEARNRSFRGEPDYIEVGAGPAGLPLHYHTVIELPRKRNGSKRSPSLNWRALFGRGALGARGKTRQVGTPPQTETVTNSLNSLRRLRPVKSADSLDGEDSLGPLLGPPPARPCGHSRSVSHDSYFDHLADAPTTTSPLDLSEIQLNFDLEEREMRIFSEEESGGVASVEASPRRQRTGGTQGTPATGGSKRKRSRLEERLQCDVELRFIDSQSPDQVMVSADVHNMETPSPLTTPGYLPLLSEASTPLSPAALQGTSQGSSPIAANSPRISFRSFTLPLDLDDDQSNANKLNRSSVSSDKTSDPSHRLSVNLSKQPNAKSCERMQSYDGRVESYESNGINSSECKRRSEDNATTHILDQEMTPCERLLPLYSEIDLNGMGTPCKNVSDGTNACSVGENDSRSENLEAVDSRKQESPSNRSGVSQNEENMGGMSNTHRSEMVGLPSSSTTDLDSPMSCEQTLEDLPDSGFVICDSSDKMFTNTETPQMVTTNTNDESGEWVIVERTAGSITMPTSVSDSPKDALEGTMNQALATEAPQLRSMSENVSRTSLDLTMCSTVETDTSCIGTSDLTESPVLAQETGDLRFDMNNAKDSKKSEAHEDCRQEPQYDAETNYNVDSSNKVADNDFVYDPDRSNGNQKICNVNVTGARTNQKSDEVQRELATCFVHLDNTNYRANKNLNSERKETPKGNEIFDNCQISSRNIELEKKELRPSLNVYQKPQIPRISDQHIFQNQPEENQERNASPADGKSSRTNERADMCQSLENSPQRQQANNQYVKYTNKNVEKSECKRIQGPQLQENVEIRIPSENAAEPCEVAHAPEGASENTSLDSSCTFSNASSPVDDSVVLRDTAAILQELALQRLSGGLVGDMSASVRKRYDSGAGRERKSFDSEIGREIVRERRMRQELDSARGKSEEPPVNSSHHLPPCLRARHARATRAALSRSLDEAKFNKMTADSALPAKQITEDSQHSSSPNVGSNANANSLGAEKLQLKNLGCLDLGDPQCRERIEKYKEERRTFLRDKYRSESFRGVTSKSEDDGEQALLTRLKQRASRPLH